MVFGSLGLDILSLFLLIVLSAFFSSSETAILTISKAKVKRLVDARAGNAGLLLEVKRNPQRILTTILIANNVVNVTTASLAAAVALDFFHGNFGVAISAGLVTFFLLIFGEIIPKSFALRHNEYLAMRSVRFLKLLSRVLSPIIYVADTLTVFFVGKPVTEEALMTEEDIKAAASLGADEGRILAEEKDMIYRVFELNDTSASQVMTPREKIVGVKSGVLVKDIDAGLLKEHARFPVYAAGLDEILGVFYLRDYLKTSVFTKGNIAVDKIMRPKFVATNETKIDRLLRELQKRDSQLAIIVDKQGKTVGIVTVEDIVEELVGEIA